MIGVLYLWCRVRISLTRKVNIAICFALWDIQAASKQILKIFVCRRLGGYMSTARWIEEEEAVRSILARLSIAVDTSRWNFMYFLWNGMLHMKLKVVCHLMNVYDFLTQNLPGGIRRSREVLEPEERSLVLQILLNLFRNVISLYLYNCQ